MEIVTKRQNVNGTLDDDMIRIKCIKWIKMLVKLNVVWLCIELHPKMVFRL